MGDVIYVLVAGGILSTPIIVVYATGVSILIPKRKTVAWIVASVIAGASIFINCVIASSLSEFDGEMATAVSFLAIVLGTLLVFIVACLCDKPVRPKD